MNARYRLVRATNPGGHHGGRWMLAGVDTGRLDALRQDGDIIAVKEHGRSVHSGLGCHQRYAPARYRVFRILSGSPADGAADVEELISWPCRPVSDPRSGKPADRAPAAGRGDGDGGVARLTRMEQAVLNHPAWDSGKPVTKHDVVSERDGDGLPLRPDGAQRILTKLNGGPKGTGPQFILWQPNLIPGVRFAYELSDLGHRTRAGEQEPSVQPARRHADRLGDCPICGQDWPALCTYPSCPQD